MLGCSVFVLFLFFSFLACANTHCDSSSVIVDLLEQQKILKTLIDYTALSSDSV